MTSMHSSVERVCTSQQSVFLAGESGPVWRVVQGIVRLDRQSGPVSQPVQLALPGDLIGTEALCGQPYRLGATAFTHCRLEAVPSAADTAPQPLLQQALLQHMNRSQDMAQLRTGSVLQRLAHLLGLLGLEVPPFGRPQMDDADAIRQALPALREVALLVDAKTETVCPFCGGGCVYELHIKNDRILRVRNEKSILLCSRGRFGFPVVEAPDRLKTPLIKENGEFRKASWDEALSLVAGKLGEIKEKHGPDSIGVLTSARITNEENYIVQKFARAVLKTNNIDHCARL